MAQKALSDGHLWPGATLLHIPPRPITHPVLLKRRQFWGWALSDFELERLVEMDPFEIDPESALIKIREITRNSDVKLVELKDFSFVIGFDCDPGPVVIEEFRTPLEEAFRHYLARDGVYAVHTLSGEMYPGTRLQDVSYPERPAPDYTYSEAAEYTDDDFGMAFAKEHVASLNLRDDEAPDIVTLHDSETGDKAILGMPHMLIRGPENNAAYPRDWQTYTYMIMEIAAAFEKACIELIAKKRAQIAAMKKEAATTSD